MPRDNISLLVLVVSSWSWCIGLGGYCSGLGLAVTCSGSNYHAATCNPFHAEIIATKV